MSVPLQWRPGEEGGKGMRANRPRAAEVTAILILGFCLPGWGCSNPYLKPHHRPSAKNGISPWRFCSTVCQLRYQVSSTSESNGWWVSQWIPRTYPFQNRGKRSDGLGRMTYLHLGSKLRPWLALSTPPTTVTGRGRENMQHWPRWSEHDITLRVIDSGQNCCPK